jgi:hypothetical protein
MRKCTPNGGCPLDTQWIDFRSAYGGSQLSRCLIAGHEVSFLHTHSGTDLEEGKGRGGS